MKKNISILMMIVLLFGVLFTGCGNQPVITPTEAPITTAPSPEACVHTDGDDDGTCDGCQVSVLVNFDFYVLNDLHGKFCDSDQQPGIDELTTYLKTKYNTDENAIFLSSGDMWQGSSESNLTNGLIITEWMNEMGFTSMTLGNHEFDWGEDVILQNDAIAEFPFLAINIYSKETNQRVEYCDASVMIERSGVQIGIIGAIGDCYSSIASDWTQDIYFLTGSDLTKLVKDEANRLREAGADFIVYSIHDGYGGTDYGDGILTNSSLSGYYDTALSKGYVDLVLEGHTHKYYVKQDMHDVYHVQGGGENQGIIHVDVNINSITGTKSVENAKYVQSKDYEFYSGDALIDSLLDKYDEQVSVGLEVLGYNRVNRSSASLRQLGAELYYQYGQQIWGQEYDIVLGGGFFSARSPGYLKNGDVTYSQLQMIFPFDNALVLCSIKGRDLKDKFFETDNERYFIHYGDYGATVKENLDPNATYYVIVDTYTSTYKYNNLTEIERYNERFYLRDMLAEYIKAGNME